ncbi:MAG: LysM peptidoglycan-binding domain-containing protein [Acetatifactor sp.]|nr:LysM peptidoglycan-binding domain-containing protein [Acetatifactor sp.]
MRNHRNLQEMSDRELRHYERVLRLRRERRRKAVMALLTVFATVCMIMVCAISYDSIRSNASSGFKYYTQVTVEAGENLWDIAEEYIDYDFYKDKNSYISEVRSINHLDSSGNIVAGQNLIFPYYSTEFVY